MLRGFITISFRHMTGLAHAFVGNLGAHLVLQTMADRSYQATKSQHVPTPVPGSPPGPVRNPSEFPHKECFHAIASWTSY